MPRKNEELAAQEPEYWMLREKYRKDNIRSKHGAFFSLEDQDQYEYNKLLDEHALRYPKGFRHYENYEAYKVFYPDSTIQDYSDESNFPSLSYISEPTG